ncbi:hypothetical protein CASFOL_003571 [Castilleja foliolosa]|uniref:TF-B3 domain-containing protein n=1 Tax=Castilleja foliolosa TaxID=1961234 RepID=A0ABD3ELA9_9LAMI
MEKVKGCNSGDYYGKGIISGSIAAVRSNRRLRNLQQRQSDDEDRPDLLSGPGFKVQRGPRMPRSRRASLGTLTFPGEHVPPHPPSAPRVIENSKLCYLFNKQLKNSDVSSLRRMVLPKKDAEIHLPVLESKEGILIYMLDRDGIHDWWFKYRYWPNNSSRMYVLESTGGFVNAHNLGTGDYILVYQNTEDGRFVIEAKKKEEYCEPNPTINEQTLDSQLLPEALYEYEYEYDVAFLDDSPFDYVGESIDLPRLGPEITFEPFDDYDPESFL